MIFDCRFLIGGLRGEFVFNQKSKINNQQ